MNNSMYQKFYLPHTKEFYASALVLEHGKQYWMTKRQFTDLKKRGGVRKVEYLIAGAGDEQYEITEEESTILLKKKTGQ